MGKFTIIKNPRAGEKSPYTTLPNGQRVPALIRLTERAAARLNKRNAYAAEIERKRRRGEIR